MKMKGKGMGCGCLVIGISIGVIGSAVVPSSAVIFVLSLLVLALGCCLLKH